MADVDMMFQIKMGHKHSKSKISHDDLQYLLKNTNHSKEEIKVLVQTKTAEPLSLSRSGIRAS